MQVNLKEAVGAVCLVVLGTFFGVVLGIWLRLHAVGWHAGPRAWLPPVVARPQCGIPL